MTSSTSEDKKSRRINFHLIPSWNWQSVLAFIAAIPRAWSRPQAQPLMMRVMIPPLVLRSLPTSILPQRMGLGRDGLTPEQIRNISNGIWLCRTHGTLIDDFQDEFPAEKVIEMKKVREFAQWLSLKLPDVAFFVGFIGVKRLDAIVWKHWPKPDEEKIRVDVISEGIKCTPVSDDPIWTQMPVPPAEFDLKPIPRAASPGPCILLLYLRRLGVNRSLQNAAAQSTLSPPGSMRSAGVGMGKGFLSTIAM